GTSFSAAFGGSNPSASHVFFYTGQPIDAADSGTGTDIYDKSTSGYTWISTGPTDSSNADCGCNFRAVSTDGLTVIFEGPEALVSQDQDGTNGDIYQRSGGTTTLITTAPDHNDDPLDVQFRAASADAQRVIFSAGQPLLTGDTDGAVDLY